MNEHFHIVRDMESVLPQKVSKTIKNPAVLLTLGIVLLIVVALLVFLNSSNPKKQIGDTPSTPQINGYKYKFNIDSDDYTIKISNDQELMRTIDGQFHSFDKVGKDISFKIKRLNVPIDPKNTGDRVVATVKDTPKEYIIELGIPAFYLERSLDETGQYNVAQLQDIVFSHLPTDEVEGAKALSNKVLIEGQILFTIGAK